MFWWRIPTFNYYIVFGRMEVIEYTREYSDRSRKEDDGD